MKEWLARAMERLRRALAPTPQLGPVPVAVGRRRRG
jgi:hypothetical protein